MIRSRKAILETNGYTNHMQMSMHISVTILVSESVNRSSYDLFLLTSDDLLGAEDT